LVQSVDAPDDAGALRAAFVAALALLQDDEQVTFLDVVDGGPESLQVQMTFAETNITLIHVNPQWPYVDLEFELGPMPLPSEQAGLWLLEMNADLAVGELAGYAVDAGGRTAVYRCRCTLEGLKLDDLRQCLAAVAEIAVIWMERWFSSATAFPREDSLSIISIDFKPV
jgi:hypothetical protein